MRISRSILDAIVGRAAENPAFEICGLLLGQGDRIVEARPAANVAPDPSHHFEIGPTTLIAAHRAARRGGPAILGYYHSHPGGSATPSETDARDAQPDGLLWLIVASGGVTAWRAGQDGLYGRFVAESVTVFDDAALASPAAARQ